MSAEQPVIIVGAGVTGLIFAQACQKKRIPFRIFERDDSASLPKRRTAEEGLTECWPLKVLEDALPDELVRRLSECHASEGGVGIHEEGHYDLFFLRTAESQRQKSLSKCVRLSREKLRMLLLTGIQVQCSKTLTEINVIADAVKAVFSDRTSETGSILIGCDGSDSTVSRIMHPQGFQAEEDFGVRRLLATAYYPTSELFAIRNMSPFFLRCIDPPTGISLYITFFERSPRDSHSDDTEKCQLLISWPYRPNWLDRVDPTDCPNTKIGQRALLKHLSESWAEPFRSLIQNMPRDADIHPADNANGFTGYSPAFGGRVTLAGRALNPVPTRLGEGAESSSASLEWLLGFLKQVHGPGVDFDFERFGDLLKEHV